MFTSACVYLVKLGPSLVELLVVDGVLQRSPHLVPFLVLRQLLLLVLQRVQSLLDVLQQLVDLLPLSLCERTKPRPNLKVSKGVHGYIMQLVIRLKVCFPLPNWAEIKSNKGVIWLERKNNWMHTREARSVLFQEEAHHPLIACVMITGSIYTWTFHPSWILIAS